MWCSSAFWWASGFLKHGSTSFEKHHISKTLELFLTKFCTCSTGNWTMFTIFRSKIDSRNKLHTVSNLMEPTYSMIIASNSVVCHFYLYNFLSLCVWIIFFVCQVLTKHFMLSFIISILLAKHDCACLTICDAMKQDAAAVGNLQSLSLSKKLLKLTSKNSSQSVRIWRWYAKNGVVW